MGRRGGEDGEKGRILKGRMKRKKMKAGTVITVKGRKGEVKYMEESIKRKEC